MYQSAPSSSVMTSIRSGFQKSDPGAAGVTTQVVSSPIGTAQPTATASLQDNLDVLDKVLSEIEQNRAVQATQPIPAVDQILTNQLVPQVEPAAQVTAAPVVPTQPDAGLATVAAEPVMPEVPAPDVVAPAMPPTELPSMNADMAAAPPVALSDLAAQASAVSDQVAAAQFDPAAQVIPQIVDQATNTLNVSYARPTAKETVAASTQAVEANAGLQVVEAEKSPEIPVEVEGYLTKVEQHPNLMPAEIVVADPAQMPTAATPYQKQPVIVLPITPEIEQTGARKNSLSSIRWLVEFSRKIMKMFTGKVIYREVESN